MRLVKQIGDAVMLVSPDPAPMVETTLTLIERAAGAEQLPRAARPASPAARRSTAGATGSARRSTSPAG